MAAPVLEFEIKGLDQLMANLRAFGEAGERAALQALKEEAERINDAAKHEVPYQYGRLEQSGTTATWTEPGWLYAIVGFGAGPSQPYALAIHEHLSEHSPQSWKIAEAKGSGVHFKQQPGVKYLERPFLAATKGLTERIAASMRAALARLGGGGSAPKTTSSFGGGGTRGGGLG